MTNKYKEEISFWCDKASDGVSEVPVATKEITKLFDQREKEIIEEIFKKLVREEGHPINKDFPIKDWETVTLSKVVKVLDDVITHLRKNK